MKTIQLLVFALCAAGFARAQPSPETPDSVVPSPEEGAARAAERPDSWITTKVKAALASHKSGRGVTEVRAESGVVTLKGKAENQAQKDLATEYAAEIDGVERVDNQLEVTGERTMDSRVEDAAITARVKTALMTRRATSAISTAVKTYNGVVTLTGSARNEDEKELAEKVARGTRGVREVDNQMSVEKP